MARKILLPVTPTERFYDAVVGAGDLVATEGGTITFLFTTIRPPSMFFEKKDSNTESEVEIEIENEPESELEEWRQRMIAALEDARALLYERGLSDKHLNYQFADLDVTPAEAIAEEAAAGAYDLVVLSRGEFIELPETPGEGPEDIASAVQELSEYGVHLMVV